MKLWKRNVIAAAIVLFVCGAVYLNWSYSQDTAAGKNLGEAALVGQTDPLQNAEEGNQDAAAQEGGGAEGDAATQEGQAAGESSYFSTARLNRQQARDNALSLLQEAAKDEKADQAAVDEANQAIQTMADATMTEAQIENLITAKGYGKRTPCSEYREQARNGKGIRAMMVTDKTGPLAAQLLVQPEEDILLITGDGTIIRARVADIRLSGRNTQGVRIMRIAEGSEVVAVARSEAEEDDLPEESDASVSDAPQAEEAHADAASDLDMDIPETTESPVEEL